MCSLVSGKLYWYNYIYLVGHGIIKSDEREIFPVKDLGHIDLVFWFSGRRKLSKLDCDEKI